MIKTFAVSQEAFSGPLGLLLELIDGKKLEITSVSLAKVADDFLSYIEAHDVPPVEVADFLVIAAKLIYVKSREILPEIDLPNEDLETVSLEDRLRLYKDFIEASQGIAGRFGVHMMYSRAPMAIERERVFTPPPSLSAPQLHEAMQAVVKRLEPFFALEETQLARAKSVEERVEELKEVLAAKVKVAFRDIVRGAERKIDVVVSFLAVLELLRSHSIVVEQGEAFGDILVERVTA